MYVLFQMQILLANSFKTHDLLTKVFDSHLGVRDVVVAVLLPQTIPYLYRHVF